MFILKRKHKDSIYSLLVAFLMAFNYIIQKDVVRVFPPYLMFTLETLIVAICMYPLHRKMPLEFKKIALLSFIWGPLTYCSLITAARMGLNVNVMLIAGKTNTLFAIILATVFLKEKIKYRTVIGIIIAFGGLIILTYTKNVSSNPIAFMLVIIFAISWSSSLFMN